MQAKRILVALDGMAPIPAWSFGETWNGFAVPWFDEGQIDAAARALSAGGLPTRLLARTSEVISCPESFDECEDAPRWRRWIRKTIETPEGPRVAFALGGLTWNDHTEGSSDDSEA